MNFVDGIRIYLGRDRGHMPSEGICRNALNRSDQPTGCTYEHFDR